jgi:menaquinone-dependent protoporphyrinogen oxidase
MKILIVSASRYGSTRVIGEWIAERLSLEDHEVEAFEPEKAPSPQAFDAVVLGSGIYADRVLPGLTQYISENAEALKTKKVALFGVAMQKEPVLHKGKIHGGLTYLVPTAEKLDGSVVHANILLGELVPKKLTEKDHADLLKFYGMIGLKEDQIRMRMTPRTLMNKQECWGFAEAVLGKL